MKNKEHEQEQEETTDERMEAALWELTWLSEEAAPTWLRMEAHYGESTWLFMLLHDFFTHCAEKGAPHGDLENWVDLARQPDLNGTDCMTEYEEKLLKDFLEKSVYAPRY